MKEYVVKLLSYNAWTNEPNAAVCDKDNLKDIDDQAIFYSSAYSDIFGIKRNRTCLERKLLSVVKITYGRHSIYRRIQSSRFVRGIGKSDVGLSSGSISLLADSVNSVVGEKVRISKGNKVMYYWFHPFHATRVSFRMGVIALLLTVLCTVISIYLSKPL